jgi:tRNA A-37 threonylcarbamoyl transferase component Bud32
MVTISTFKETHLRIRNPQIILGLRVVWALAFTIALIATLVSLEAYIRTCNCKPEIVAEWERMGIVQGVRIIFVILTAIHFTILMTLSTLLIWRRPDDRMAVFVAFTSIIYAIFLVTGPTASSATWYYTVRQVTNFLTPIMWIALFFVFPNGHFVPSWSKYLLGAFTVALLAAFLAPESINKPVSLAVSIMGLAGLIIGLGGMVYRLRKIPSAEERQQLKGFFMVFGAAIVLSLIAIPFRMLVKDITTLAIVTFFTHILMATLQMAVPAAIAFAILRYRLWDIDLAVNKALVSAIVTVGLLLFFIVGFFTVNITTNLLGINHIYVSVALPAALTALLFNPVRKQVRRFVDKSIYGFRFDLDQLHAAQRELAINAPGFYTGRTLSDVRLLDVVGKGGMGEIYKGVREGKDVAVKVIPANLLEDESIIQRFEREARALLTLHHPNIVSCVEYGAAENTHFLVMELLNGQDLATYFKQRGKLTLDEIRAVVQDIAAALDYAHMQGIVHRDIKPGNVMLAQRGDSQKAVLMDFGIAKLSDGTTSITTTGTIGTVDYISPEQIMSSGTVDHRTDIYAMGVMLYQMLTGELPYKGSAGQILFGHLYQPVPDIRSVAPDVPEEIADAIEKALSKKPEQRFDSMREFAVAFAA